MRPNSDVIPPNCAICVRIFTQENIQETQITNDKFLIQLALLDFQKKKQPKLPSELISKVRETEQGTTPTGGASEGGPALSIDELGQLWDWVDKVEDVVQFKMRVELDAHEL